MYGIGFNVVILPQFRKNFENIKHFANECKVMPYFVHWNGDIFSMKCRFVR